MKVSLRCLTVAMVVSLLPLVPASASTLDCADEDVHDYELRMRALSDVYSLGDTAVVKVRVMRSLEGRDLGPATDAKVTVGLEAGEVVLSGSDTTNERGVALIKIRIPRWTPLGLVDAHAHAYKEVVSAPCMRPAEQGSHAKEDLLKVVR